MSTPPESSSPSAAPITPPVGTFSAPVPLSAAAQRQYEALRAGVTWFSDPVGWSRIEGSKAADALNGLVTNEVGSLAVGASQYAAALSPKGKMVADMTIVRAADNTFLVAVDEAAMDGWLALARKYINPRLARTTDDRGSWTTCAIHGRDLPAALTTLGLDGAPTQDGPESTVRLVSRPTLAGVPGVWLLIPAAQAEPVRAQLIAACGPEAEAAVAELLRLEGGRPRMFVDMDENTIPQEANLDQLDAISFTKGCYTGQETVARVHFRGHVNRHLRALSSPVPLVRGSQLEDDTGKVIGDVRSSAISPRLGPIAIGMVRREIAPGTTVHMRPLSAEGTADATADARVPVRVDTLPFAG